MASTGRWAISRPQDLTFLEHPRRGVAPCRGRVGPFLAGRLTASFFSIILIAGAYSWTSLAFNRKLALYTAAGLAVSFWAVMTGRHSLRSITLPAVFILSVIFYWRASTRARKGSFSGESNGLFSSPVLNFLAMPTAVIASTLLTSEENGK